MATLAPMSPHTRQPFGVIGESRLRNLGNVKNKQNALNSFQPSNLKTFSSQPQVFDDIDSENIDPAIFASPTKASTYSKTADNMNFLKPAKFTLTRATQVARRADGLSGLRGLSKPKAPLFSGTKRKAESDSIPSETPLGPERPVKSPRRSPPPPAGRSPKSKRVGILSRHRTPASPFTRVNPPSFGNNKAAALPFSIDAALAGTLSSYKSHKPAPAETILESMPKGWQFSIYTDSQEEEAGNLMEHSTSTLDISDDENSVSKHHDEENKENIPPRPGMNAPTLAAMQASRKHMMTDEPRSPLGELEASDYYAAGCDATSYITIPDEEDIKSNINAEASTAFAPAKDRLEAIDENTTWNDLAEMAKSTNNTTGLTPAMRVMSAAPTTSAPVLEQGPILTAPTDAPIKVEDDITTNVNNGVAATATL